MVNLQAPKYKAASNKAILPKYGSGFTLIELMVVIAVVVIISSIATPLFIKQFKLLEAHHTRQHIENAIRYAKTESLIYRQNLILCPADKQLRCDKNANDFLMVFTDEDNNKLFDADDNTLLLKLPLDLDYGKIHLRASSRRNHFKFFGDTGLPRGHIGHIKYCPKDKDSSHTYLVSLNMQGITRYKPKQFHETDCPA